MSELQQAGAIIRPGDKSVVKRGQDTPVTAIQKIMTANIRQLEMATRSIRPEKLIRLATTALNTVPKLQECSLPSILNSIMLSAQLGLEFNNGLGHAYLIPYGRVCTFQPGYRGLIELAYRGEAIDNIVPIIVYQGDLFEYEEGQNPKLIHRPCKPSQRKPVSGSDGEYEWIGAYSRVRTKDGRLDFFWMWREEILEVRDKASKAKNDGPWKTWFAEMVKKTPIKRHMKFIRLAGEAEQAVGLDDQAEAFTSRDAPGSGTDIAQDLVLPPEVQEQAEEADFNLQGSREHQEDVAKRKITTLQGRATTIQPADLKAAEPKPGASEFVPDREYTQLLKRAHDIGWTTDDLRAMLRKGGIENESKIPRSRWAEVVAAVEGGGTVEDEPAEAEQPEQKPEGKVQRRLKL